MKPVSAQNFPPSTFGFGRKILYVLFSALRNYFTGPVWYYIIP